MSCASSEGIEYSEDEEGDDRGSYDGIGHYPQYSASSGKRSIPVLLAPGPDVAVRESHPILPRFVPPAHVSIIPCSGRCRGHPAASAFQRWRSERNSSLSRQLTTTGLGAGRTGTPLTTSDSLREMYPPPKRRRLLALAGAAILAVGVGVWVLPNKGEEPASQETTWRGLWPQESREEGQQAQAAADAGDPRYSWQLGADGEEVVLRYVRGELGWTRPQPLEIRIPKGAEGWLRRWRLLRCAPKAANPDYREVECAPPTDRAYPAVHVTVERLFRRGEAGLWIVTGVETDVVHQPEPASRLVVRRVVAAFLERRIRGVGAEKYLSADGQTEFGVEFGENPLYSPPSGPHFVRYDIAFVDGPSWPSGNFEVGVRMILSSGGVLENTLFVAPGINALGERRKLVVVGRRPGLTGP